MREPHSVPVRRYPDSIERNGTGRDPPARAPSSGGDRHGIGAEDTQDQQTIAALG